MYGGTGVAELAGCTAGQESVGCTAGQESAGCTAGQHSLHWQDTAVTVPRTDLLQRGVSMVFERWTVAAGADSWLQAVMKEIV